MAKIFHLCIMVQTAWKARLGGHIYRRLSCCIFYYQYGTFSPILSKTSSRKYKDGRVTFDFSTYEMKNYTYLRVCRSAPSLCKLETYRSPLYHKHCGYRQSFCQGWLFLQKPYSTHIQHKQQKDFVKVYPISDGQVFLQICVFLEL